MDIADTANNKMYLPDESNVVIQPLAQTWYHNQVTCIDMLRLDLLHPIISGNKWYKLQLNLQYARENGFTTIVTSGGGYSNHLVATAHAAKLFGMQSVGIIRGRYNQLTPSLEACKHDGMELIFITKEEYDCDTAQTWTNVLKLHHQEYYIIPEGGANKWGRAGAGLISRFCDSSYSHIALSVGSGTTFIGLRQQLNGNQNMLGFVPMKGGTYLGEYISKFVSENNDNWQLYDAWHFGGFGKWDQKLIDFMNDFYRESNIPLDIIYTAKMMFGIKQLINEGFFGNDNRILCIQTGGLQGNVAVKDQLIF